MISFTEATGAKVYIDNRQQDSKKANTAWTQGFIRAGVERPNQRIGIYVLCLSVAKACWWKDTMMGILTMRNNLIRGLPTAYTPI